MKRDVNQFQVHKALVQKLPSAQFNSVKAAVCVYVHVQVVQALQVKYGDLYQQDNVVLSGTHTHCGLGGYFQYTLFMVTSKGYIKESSKPLVDGIVKVCVRFIDWFKWRTQCDC